MPRPGRTKITSFPPQGTVATSLPTVGTTPTALPPPLPLAAQPQNIGLPPELIAEEPVTFPEGPTIEDLIEFRTITSKSEKSFWCAGDKIWELRDELNKAHNYSLLKGMQALAIATYKAAKIKVPKDLGKEFGE